MRENKWMCVFLLIPTMALCLKGQALVDPFYSSALDRGEVQYLSGNYVEALKSLEMAMFGLSTDRQKTARAKTLKALCHYRLEDLAPSEEFLMSALDLLDGEDYDPALPERIASDLQILKGALGLEGQSLDPPATIRTEPEPERTVKKALISPPESPEKSIGDLETLIKTDPAGIQNYYDLYEIYRQQGDTKNARKVIKRLIENNPDEIDGSLLLMKIEFRMGNFKESLSSSRRILEISDRPSVSGQHILSSLIYATLCSLRLDRRDDLESLMRLLFELYENEEMEKIISGEKLEADWTEVLREAGR